MPSPRKIGHHTPSPSTRLSPHIRTGRWSPSLKYLNYDPQKEPLKAYLRIRPHEETAVENAYIQVIGENEVEMTPPEDSNAYRARNKSSERYRFTKIFCTPIDQHSFFNKTTKGLVKDVLDGYNALIFAYGVTNSGKTYTIMGSKEEAGILPRTLNTIFNSIHGHQSNRKIKPFMHSLLETYMDPTDEHRICDDENEKCLFNINDDTKIEIDTQYEYGIWISFIEVYNEQIYDLLLKTPKRHQLHLKYEHKSGNKYVSNMQMIRVRTLKEAYAALKLGQQNRQVFATIMNQTSSRSHSIFTVRVVRCPANQQDEESKAHMATLSTMSIVDLAGSERYRNTNSTGLRLKEAGNINKSLMVLGQCMDILRQNQLRIEQGKSPLMVPYRHSKLTEMFKSTFEGDGKAAIIVNVNPYDTGFDENNHVMKFSAVARDIVTRTQLQPRLDLSPLPTKRHYPFSDPKTPIDGSIKDNSVDQMLSYIQEIKEKWKSVEDRIQEMEVHIRQQVTKEMEYEIGRYSELYFNALNREHELRETQLSIYSMDIDTHSDNAQDGSLLLYNLQTNQEAVLRELSDIKEKMGEHEDIKQALMNKIAELERDCSHSHHLLAQVQSAKLADSFNGCLLNDKHHDHFDGEQNDVHPESDYAKFLDLRKRLRRSIFKREELYEDADAIMKQVEAFEGVTFQMAKDTNMGKLLTLIAQEQFEKDPYLIKERAIRLLKRYAQLLGTPSTDDSNILESSAENVLPTSDMYTMDKLKIENACLVHQIRMMNEDKKKLQDALESTVHYIRQTENVPIQSREGKDMEVAEEEGSGYDESNPSSIIDDEYESGAIAPKRCTKKRRKLRSY